MEPLADAEKSPQEHPPDAIEIPPDLVAAAREAVTFVLGYRVGGTAAGRSWRSDASAARAWANSEELAHLRDMLRHLETGDAGRYDREVLEVALRSLELQIRIFNPYSTAEELSVRRRAHEQLALAVRPRVVVDWIRDRTRPPRHRKEENRVLHRYLEERRCGLVNPDAFRRAREDLVRKAGYRDMSLDNARMVVRRWTDDYYWDAAPKERDLLFFYREHAVASDDDGVPWDPDPFA